MVNAFLCGCDRITVDTSRIIAVTNNNFINVAIDSGVIRRNWENLQLNSTKVQTLAAGLAPCYLRVGGTDADFLIFGNNPNSYKTKVDYSKTYQPSVTINKRQRRDLGYSGSMGRSDFTNFTMNTSMYDQLHKFVSAVGWEMIFDLNSLLRNNGAWDPTNAIQLINYTASQGYKMGGWELGNEPDEYSNPNINKPVQPEQLAKDYQLLSQIVQSYPQYRDSVIMGPSIAAMSAYQRKGFYYSFLSAGGGDVVTAATFHQYYENGAVATADDFVNPDVLNILYDELHAGVNLTRAAGCNAKVWLGETSSCWGGGAPGLSDTFLAAFMWLDKLGMSARDGIDAVVRQTFYGGHYSLIDNETLDPNPDYWLTLMYNLLVGSKVLAVTSPDSRGDLRVYAHCTDTERSGYAAGSVTVYIMNLSKTNKRIMMPNFPTHQLHIYNFMAGSDSVTSKTVRLNGEPLVMTDDRTLPNLLKPFKIASEVYVRGLSYSFIVIPDANVAVCK